MSVGTALMIGGKAASTAFSAYSAYYAGKAAQLEAKNNARIARLNAKALERKTTFDQIQQQRRGQAIMGALTAKLGASGAVVSEGAPSLALADQAWELAFENMMIGVEGRTQAAAAEYQANVFDAQRRNIRAASRQKVFATLLGGFGSMASAGMLDDIMRPTETGTLFFNRWEL